KLKNFWMVSTLPLSASITGVGVMRAGWWAYRNPEIALDAVLSYFPATAPTPSLAGAAGFGTSKIYDITE
ncbi:MAG: hypothetical protein RBR54_04545, partial [Sulfurimonas sp.]|nr:hypothetical protein [Sulfurimonas sp.]